MDLKNVHEIEKSSWIWKLLVIFKKVHEHGKRSSWKIKIKKPEKKKGK